MKFNTSHFAPLVLAFGLVSGAAQAALHDRGGGLIYDDVLDVTWLQDANYAKTSGYHFSGAMLGNDALTWAANLVYHDSVRNVDWSDWRLPTVAPINGASFVYGYDVTGMWDIGYNISAPGSAYPGSTASELAYMHYQNLGNLGGKSLTDVTRTCYFITTSCLDNVGPFVNIQSDRYWTGNSYDEPETSDMMWYFSMHNGYQGGLEWYAPEDVYAWAVRDGDVAAVPEADTWTMLLAGLGVVGMAVRRKARL